MPRPGESRSTARFTKRHLPDRRSNAPRHFPVDCGRKTGSRTGGIGPVFRLGIYGWLFIRFTGPYQGKHEDQREKQYRSLLFHRLILLHFGLKRMILHCYFSIECVNKTDFCFKLRRKAKPIFGNARINAVCANMTEVCMPSNFRLESSWTGKKLLRPGFLAFVVGVLYNPNITPRWASKRKWWRPI